MKRPNPTYNKILLLLAAGLLACMVGSVTLGRYPIGLKELGGILASRIWELEPFWTKTQESLLLQHRLPRILLACLVGGSLACAGAAYQGVFQNPMAQIVLYTLAPDMLTGLAAKWSGSAEGIVPEEYLQLPYLGQPYNTANLNVEELALAAPQVIIDIGRVMSTADADMDALHQQTGIPTIFLRADFDALPQTYRTLGQLLGRAEEAEKLASFCERVYQRTLSILEQVGDNKVTALYIKGEQGTSVLAKGSAHAQTLDLLTDNLAVVDSPSSKGSGNEVTLEQIALWDPELILFDADSIYDTVAGLDTWSTLSAIACHSYLEVPESPWNWLGMIWLTAQLYPEYCDYDPKAEILEFYELFYHCRLTQQQYEELTANASVR